MTNYNIAFENCKKECDIVILVQRFCPLKIKSTQILNFLLDSVLTKPANRISGRRQEMRLRFAG